MLLIVNFSRNSSAFWLFLRIKLAFSHLGLKPIASSFLVNNLYFITYITHRGKSTDRLQPVKKPPRKYCPFLLLNVSLLIRDRNVSLVEVYWRYPEFQFVFPNKSRWNYIFQATNCRRIILIFSLVRWTAVDLVVFLNDGLDWRKVQNY